MKIKYYLSSVLVLMTGTLLVTGCNDDFLDRKPDDQMDEEQVFVRYDKVNQLVTDLYANAKDANKPLVFFNHFSTAAVTDE